MLIKVANHVFEIRYGYYDERDKYLKFNEQVLIFPNFIEEPKYTLDGFQLVTKMQDICMSYKNE